MASPPFLDTVLGEIAFFRALIYHRPVGKDRLSTMLKIHQEIKEAHPSEYVEDSEADLWRKYGELYDFEGAEEVVSRALASGLDNSSCAVLSCSWRMNALCRDLLYENCRN